MDLTQTAKTIRFAGGAERTAPMTWGQKAIYSSIRWLGDDAYYFNLMRVIDVPDGLDVDGVLAALSTLFVRHDVLRTRFHETDDGWVQRVHAAGDATVQIVQVRDGRADEVARELVARLARHTFRHDEEPPLSLGLVLGDAGPSHVVFAVSHLAADGWASDLLKRDLIGLLGGAHEESPSWSPVDQAQHESGEAGLARGTAAVEYWRRTLSTVPRSLFGPVVAEERADRFVRLAIESRALAVASTIVAARCGVSTGTVLLAATAIVLGRFAGQDRIALQLIASNRLDDRSRGLVGALAQDALFAIDVSPADEEGGFAVVARRAFGAGLNAYRHAQYDPDDLRRLREQQRATGDETDLGYYFNDMRIGRDWGVDVDAFDSVDAVRELAALTETTFVGAWERQDARYFVGVVDTEGTCILSLMADTEAVSRAQIEELLRQTESVVIEAVADAGVAQVRR